VFDFCSLWGRREREWDNLMVMCRRQAWSLICLLLVWAVSKECACNFPLTDSIVAKNSVWRDDGLVLHKICMRWWRRRTCSIPLKWRSRPVCRCTTYYLFWSARNYGEVKFGSCRSYPWCNVGQELAIPFTTYYSIQGLLWLQEKIFWFCGDRTYMVFTKRAFLACSSVELRTYWNFHEMEGK
jgi:hypothetical protein